MYCTVNALRKQTLTGKVELKATNCKRVVQVAGRTYHTWTCLYVLPALPIHFSEFSWTEFQVIHSTTRTVSVCSFGSGTGLSMSQCLLSEGVYCSNVHQSSRGILPVKKYPTLKKKQKIAKGGSSAL